MAARLTCGVRSADKSRMHPSRCAALGALSAALACLALAAPVATAAPEIIVGESQGILMNVAADPDSGRSLAITGRAMTDPHGYISFDLFASAIGSRGRADGAARSIGDGMKPDMAFNGGAQVSVAADSRRGRRLVAWSAHKDGMGQTACQSPAPSLTFSWDLPCAQLDTEIFVRVLDRAGRPIGPQRQVTSIGPRASGQFGSSSASVAYDARADTFLLVFAARVTGVDAQAAIVAQRLRPDGEPIGGPRPLALQPAPVSIAPVSRLAADPRGGYLLAYTWGETFRDRRLYTRRLTPAGRTAGPTTALTTRGAGSVELAFDRRRRRALVVYSNAVPGAKSGFRARLLTAGGRPLAATADLPYRMGTGPVIVASNPDRGGWAYGFVREGDGLAREVLVQRASSTGRPTAAARLVSQPGHRAFEPAITAIPGGTLLVAWSEQPIRCDAGGGCIGGGGDSIHARLIRP